MPDGFHISCLAAHQVAGTLPVIEGKILLQKLAVYGAAHIIQNALGSRLEDQLIQETQHTVQQCNRQQTYNQLWQQIIIAGLDDIIHNNAGNIRIDNGQRRDDSGQEQAQNHQVSVTLQKTVEPFYRCHMVSSLARGFPRGLCNIVLFRIQKEMEYLAPLMENFVPGNEKRVLLLNPKRVK